MQQQAENGHNKALKVAFMSLPQGGGAGRIGPIISAHALDWTDS